MKLIAGIFVTLFLIVTSNAITGQFTSVCDNRVISDVSDTGGICYEESLATDMRDWNSAFNNCPSTNRRLARVLNEEMSAEIERITQDTDEYWIGLSRPDSNSEFMWSDGTSVSYTRWSSGHPIDGLNCVSVRGDSTEWYSSDCSDVKRYVCERDVCVDWTVRNGICYKTFDPRIDVDAAISVCQSHNAYLAEIPNIYVDNVTIGIIGDFGGGLREHWIGLRTNATHYYWRIGDFSLGNDALSDSDRNKCGAVDGNNGNRWIIGNCDDTNTRLTMCMIGPLTNEIPIERCENSSTDTLVYEDSCYTRITVNERNLDRATLTCTDYYNGTLYDLSDTTVNEEIRRKFGNGNDLSIVDPNEYRFTAQDGYFNLYTSFENSDYPINPNCVTINSEGVLSDSGRCPDGYLGYICKRDYTPSTSTATSTTTVMSTSAPTMNTEINCSQNPATAVCATLLGLTYEPIMGMDLLIQIEMSLEMLSNSTTIGTGQIVRGFNKNLQAEILITNVDSNTGRTFSFDDVTMEINDQSFENNVIVTSAVYNSKNYANIASEFITIIASERLAGNLTMIFSLMNQTEETTLMCSSYTNSSKWISDGIITEEKESAIECTTNHLTTFAVTRVIKVTTSGKVNCSELDSKDVSFCDTLEVIVPISIQQVESLQYVDVYLESVLLLYNVTTGVRLEIVRSQQVLVIIGIRQNETTPIPVGENVVTANPNLFPDDTVLVVLSTSFNDTRNFTNDSLRIVSDIITIQASNELEGNLTIQFSLRRELKMYNDESIRKYNYFCAFLESDGTWSRYGITTQIINSSAICITTHLSVFALLSTSSICDVTIGEIHKALLQATSYTLLSVSLLFLIATIIAFLYSWKQVFHIDINILNFNYSIVLSLAIFVSIIGTDLAPKNPIVCHVSAFLTHFLWSSVFLSSLSTTILVFYSIWIVGIKHQARKLSPYLIPISWTISGIWALIWLAVGLVNDIYINSNIYDNTECTQPCVLSTESELIYAFIVPIIVIICINLCILFLNLFRIRKVFKISDRNEMEIVRLRKVAFGGLLLVPSLGIPFILSIPLSFSPLYINTTDDNALYIILKWVSLISTGTIGIIHFLLVTYQTPEVRLPKFLRSNRGGKAKTSQTSSSNSRVPPQEAVLRFNVVKRPKIHSTVFENENTETEV